MDFSVGVAVVKLICSCASRINKVRLHRHTGLAVFAFQCSTCPSSLAKNEIDERAASKRITWPAPSSSRNGARIPVELPSGNHEIMMVVSQDRHTIHGTFLGHGRTTIRSASALWLEIALLETIAATRDYLLLTVSPLEETSFNHPPCGR